MISKKMVYFDGIGLSGCLGVAGGLFLGTQGRPPAAAPQVQARLCRTRRLVLGFHKHLAFFRQIFHVSGLLCDVFVWLDMRCAVVRPI